MNDYRLNKGANRLEVRLAIAKLQDEMNVTVVGQLLDLLGGQNRRESISLRPGPFHLRVDPEEFEAALKEMGGPGAVIRVNGFRGGKLPPKSQIREIRFRRNSFAAENHEPGFVSIDIFTKPGSENWHGVLNFAFRDAALNARNVFAPIKGPLQFRRLGLTLEGRLVPNRTSFFVAVEGNSSDEGKTIIAALPEGNFSGLASQPWRSLNLSGRVEHALTSTHTLPAEYQRNAIKRNNLGVGDFDLPERTNCRTLRAHLFFPAFTPSYRASRSRSPSAREIRRCVKAKPDGDMLGAVSSATDVTEKRWRMEFYVQAYNIFNHANYTRYTGVLTSPFYGQATAALPARRIETGVRFSF